MNIRLIQLTIEKFKGINQLILKLDGDNAWIRGENGTGKTTVADAFFWLFSNSNSDQRSNFNIIPLDKSGNVVNYTEPMVESIIDADGRRIKLKKIYKQVWTKRRGAEKQELTGHTTDYFFDEVPISKTEYENRINEIIKTDLFRALSDVKYFCGSTSPQYRRNILMDITGAITDNDIIKEYEELSELPAILNGRSIDDYRKVLGRNRRAINRKLDELPASIKERLHGRPDIEKLNADGLTSQMIEIDQAIAVSRQKISDLGSGVEIAQKRKDNIEITTQLAEIEIRIKNKYKDKRESLSERNGKILAEISRKSIELESTTALIRELNSNIKANAEKRAKLLDNWELENRKKFVPKTTCFACGQGISGGMVEIQEKEFNIAKEKVLATINSQGESLFAQYESLTKKLKTETEHLEFINTQIKQLNDQIKSINQKLELIGTDIDSEVDKESVSLRGRMAELSKEIETMNSDIEPRRKVIEDSIIELENSKKIIQSEMDKITKAREIDERVKELESELKDQGRALERNAYEGNLLDKFLRYRAEYIEETVSNNFTITEWKLFEELIGGGYKDICEPLYEGIPYNTDLNTGARINIGMDVIATMSRHYKTNCPIFIDNAESITGWIPTSNQIIRLAADPGRDGLEVTHGD